MTIWRNPRKRLSPSKATRRRKPRSLRHPSPNPKRRRRSKSLTTSGPTKTTDRILVEGVICVLFTRKYKAYLIT